MQRLVAMLLFAMFLVPHAQGQTFETLEDFSFIQDSANYNEKTELFMSGDSAMVDGSVTSFPPDRTTYDRTLVSIFRTGYNHRINPKFAVRPVIDARYVIHKVHEEEEPRNVEEEEFYQGRLSLDLIYTTAAGIEVFGGAQYWYFPEHTSETESVNFSAETKYGEATMWVPRVGLMKRTSFFEGGLFYMKGTERERSVEKTSSDGTTVNTDDIVYSPTEIGLFVRADIKGYITDLEFTAVQAGSGGPTAGESRTPILEDYTRGRLGVLIPWQKSELNFHARIVHKTLSYAGSDFVTLQTLPMTTLHLKVINGSPTKHLYYGLIYGYTKDTQSTEEFNQKYIVNSYGGKVGLRLQF